MATVMVVVVVVFIQEEVVTSDGCTPSCRECLSLYTDTVKNNCFNVQTSTQLKLAKRARLCIAKKTKENSKR